MNVAIFIILALLIAGCSLWAVTTPKMFRAATSLLFVLIATAGLYLLLGYHFLAMVQVAVYVGGVLVLFVFAILLTSGQGDTAERHEGRRKAEAALIAVVGIVVTTLVTAKHDFLFAQTPTNGERVEIPMQTIGTALIGSGKYEYLLAFEVLSVLLLACVIGGIIIARKR